MKRKFLNIILVLLSMLTIFLFSSEDAVNSTNTSNNVAKEIVSVVVKDEVKANKIVDSNFVIFRKVAHLTEYFILGSLLVNVWADGKKDITFKYVVVCVLVACLYAVSDEVHQSLIPGRAGRVLDVGIDTLGSFLGALSYYSLFKHLNKKKLKNI